MIKNKTKLVPEEYTEVVCDLCGYAETENVTFDINSKMYRIRFTDHAGYTDKTWCDLCFDCYNKNKIIKEFFNFIKEQKTK